MIRFGRWFLLISTRSGSTNSESVSDPSITEPLWANVNGILHGCVGSLGTAPIQSICERLSRIRGMESFADVLFNAQEHVNHMGIKVVSPLL
jgi:hypothetical protein